MSAILCVAVYYAGLIGPAGVHCTKVSLLERSEAMALCDRSSNCRVTRLDDEVWLHVRVEAPLPKSVTDRKTVKI